MNMFRKLFLTFFVMLALAGCTAEGYTPVPSTQSVMMVKPSMAVMPTMSPTVTPTPTEDLMLQAQVALLYAHATDTQIAIVKTEQALADMRSTNVAGTNMAEILSTARASQTYAAGTAQATITQGAQTAAANITATSLEATQQIERNELMARKAGIWGGFFAVSLAVLLGLVWVGVMVWRSYKSSQADYLQKSRMQHDANGRLDAVPEDAVPKGRLIIPTLAHRAIIKPEDDLDTEQALQNTQGHRQLEAVRSVANSPFVKRLIHSSRQGQASVTGDAALSSDVAQLPFPDWSLLNSWKGGMKPLGMGGNGLITAAAASPHILISGQTTSGKTHFLMRPYTTLALANSEQVFILSLSSNGYGVFDGHPNCYRVQLQDAREIIPVLKAAYRELRERDAMIGGRDLTWEQWQDAPRPKIMLALDELGNMAEQIYTEHRDPKACLEMWGYLRLIAREGSKVGMTFLAALQEPTAKSVDLSFRRNCTRVGFRMDRDSSQALLDVTGAEQLETGRFIARVSTLVHGAGFAPTDDEIIRFLSQHDVAPLEKPSWIDGRSSSIESEQLPSGQPSADDERAKVLRLAGEGMSNTAIVYEIWGKSGSNFAERMKQVKAILATASTATASNNPNFPLHGAVA